MKQAVSIHRLRQIKIDRLNLSFHFEQAFAQPQNRGVWFVWGNSASGKSSFIMQLAKELAREFKVHYNSLEEDYDDASFIERTELFMMDHVADKFSVQNDSFDELIERLDKKGSAKVVIIDSATYFFSNFKQYLELKNKYKEKIFIITGHAQGANPRSELEKDIMFDAYMKIRIDAFGAYCKGRSIGANGGKFIIWKEKYEELNGTQN
ncbi:nSTAND3 domain-containing NTPase [Chryseobacterium daeguense]|uniref:nSTAND3 domain-containing NTPase n=1 Tax=Chryseobacterium daeguense TaxID=412438 RepID=UPI0004002E85|nr:hypothetical protein [Chryseobacterium daeguense]